MGTERSFFELSEAEEKELRAAGYERGQVGHRGIPFAAPADLGGGPVFCWTRGPVGRYGRKIELFEFMGCLLSEYEFRYHFAPGAWKNTQRRAEKWDLLRMEASRLRKDPTTAVYRLVQRKDSGCRIARLILWAEARREHPEFYGEDWDGDITDLFSPQGSRLEPKVMQLVPEEPPVEPEEAQAFWEWWAEEILPLKSRKSWGFVW